MYDPQPGSIRDLIKDPPARLERDPDVHEPHVGYRGWHDVVVAAAQHPRDAEPKTNADVLFWTEQPVVADLQAEARHDRRLLTVGRVGRVARVGSGRRRRILICMRLGPVRAGARAEVEPV